MLPDDLSAKPEPSEPGFRNLQLRLAVGASVLLHLGLAFAISRAALTPAEHASDTVAAPALTVHIATRSPQRESAPPAPPPLEESLPNTPEIATAPAPAIAAPAVSDAPVAIAEAEPEPGSAEDQTAPALDMDRLQNSISTQLGAYRRDVLDQQMQECQQYRERYQRWDCPQGAEVKSATQQLIEKKVGETFRAWVSGYDSNERFAHELLVDMDTLRPLMDNNGIVGALARERYYIKAVQYRNLVPELEEGGTITLVSLSGGGLALLNGWMTIGFDGNIRTGDQARGPARSLGEDEE